MKNANTLHARTKAFARDNFWKSWWCILSTAFLLALAVTGTLPFAPLWVRLPCSLLSALLLVRLFVIFHDHQHRAILPKSRLADLFMRCFGMISICPSTVWRRTHDDHHAHNCQLRVENIGSFPIMTKEHFQNSSLGERTKYLL